MCLAQTWHIPGVDLPWTPACPALPPAPRSSCRAGQVQPCRSSNQVTVRPPRRRQPQLAASPATSPSPRPPSASPPQARSCGTPRPPRSVTSTRTTPPAAWTVDRDRLPLRARAAIPDAVPEQLHQQRGVIPARMPRAEHPGRERAGHPGPLRPPGHRHALPDNRPGHQRTRLPRPPAARETTRNRRRTYGDARPTRRPASSQETAAGAARPWPSVEQPTVRTDRDGARIPSAIRPWTPRHIDPQRHKMTHHGTRRNGPPSVPVLSSLITT